MADVTRAELEEIIRRAVELQFASDAADDVEHTEEEVFRIGRQVGLERRFLERAVAEVRASGFRPDPPPDDDSLLARLLGPGFVRASRYAAGAPPALERLVEHELQVNERLRRVERRADGTRWAAADGWRSGGRSSTDQGSEGHAYDLGTARALDVRVQEADGERSLVTVTADLRNQRTDQLLTWVTALGLAGLVVGGFLVVAGAPWAFLAPIPPLAFAVAGVKVSVHGYRKDHAHLQNVVESFLRRLDRTNRPEPEEEPSRRAPPFF